jgi:hypothetical protein
VAREHAPHLARQLLQPLLPVLGIERRQLNLPDDPVEDEQEQLLLVADVPVERGRRSAELLRDAAHARGLEALAVDHSERGVDDRVAAERRARCRAVPPCPRPRRLGDGVRLDVRCASLAHLTWNTVLC